MKIIECLQGSTEWAMARAGVVTASEIDALVSPTFKVREGAGVQTYLYEKVAERIMGYAETSNAGTFHMENGSLLEKVALPWYEFTHNVSVKRVGFVTTDDGRIGCSPDGLIPEKQCGMEIKCPKASTHLKYLLGGFMPAEYATQVQFSMFVTGYPEWIFCSYHPHLPAFVIHALRDLKAHAAFEAALKPFLATLDENEERVRMMLNASARKQERDAG